MDDMLLIADQAEARLNGTVSPERLCDAGLHVLPGGLHRRRLRTMSRVPPVAAFLLITGCSSGHPDMPHPPLYAINHPERTFLSRTSAAQLDASPGESGFYLLVSGQESFLARAALAEASEKTLEL